VRLMSEDNPVISVLINATERINDCVRFMIRNSGILKIPTAEVVLWNQNGKFTTGTDKINLYDEVKISANVRGISDLLFVGKVFAARCRIEQAGTIFPSFITLFCRASYAQKLVRDYITFDYADRGTMCNEAIEDMLTYPDSRVLGEETVGTGIILTTDTGDITKTVYPENLIKRSILDAIRVVSEALNYDGYWTGDTWNELVFKKVGTEAVNPSVTLSHPFIQVEINEDLDEMKNLI